MKKITLYFPKYLFDFLFNMILFVISSFYLLRSENLHFIFYSSIFFFFMLFYFFEILEDWNEFFFNEKVMEQKNEEF